MGDLEKSTIPPSSLYATAIVVKVPVAAMTQLGGEGGEGGPGGGNR